VHLKLTGFLVSVLLSVSTLKAQEINPVIMDKFYGQFGGTASDSAFLMSLRGEDLRQVEKLVKKRIKVEVEYYDGYLFLAYMKSLESDWKAAIKLLDEALSLESGDPDLYFMKGNIFLEQEMYQDALTNYKLSLKKDPEYTNALNNIAVLRIRNQGSSGLHQNDLKLAKSDILEIFEIDSTSNERVLMNIGLIHIGLFEHGQAFEYFSKIIEKQDVLLPEAYFNRGLSLYYQRAYLTAKDDFLQSREHGFDSVRVGEYINHIEYILESGHKID
jgi:tetratricopeptide (TPR) repeat protein